MTHNSQELGNAFADVLFGDYNPAGRLTQTWVKSITDLPDFLDYDITKGRTYMYSKKEPLYAFGHGLSYTTFNYSNLKTDKNTLRDKDSITVSFNVKNTGKRDGEEVSQLYVKHLNSEILRPMKELKSFRRLFLKAGETKTVSMVLRTKDLEYWNTNKQQFELEKDAFEIQIGQASDKILLTKKITIEY